MSPRDHARAGEVLAKAFRGDPLWSAVIPDEETRPAALAGMFTALANAVSAARGVGETTSGFESVALWLPPGREIGFRATLRSGFALPRFVSGLPSQERKRMLAVLAQLDEKRKESVPESHWYLSAVGVEPDSQGRGLGSALVRSGIAKAERDDAPIYLETETEGNVGYYEGLGFRVIDEIAATGLDLPIWLMIRPPETAHR